MPYPITATFIDEITYDITPQNWGEKEWIKDIENMQNAGIDTLVIMRGVFYDKILYPSKHFKDKKSDYKDFIELILNEADKRNMDVYIGLYISNLTWNDGDYVTELKENEFYVSEILEKYNHHKSFIGWYLPHEVGHNNYNFVPVTTGLIEILKRKSPEKKIFISPFYRDKDIDYPEPTLSPEETYKEWDEMFKVFGKDIDCCAFQDGTCSLQNLDKYMYQTKLLCDKYNIEMWSNIETFKRLDGFPPQDLETLKAKIEIAKKYCKKLITFEFSHFLSPQSMYEKARQLNAQYLEYYK
ncbi:MAG: DUF4434 domain-containing protein [Bacilli bacterium]|nr:DUF4434 domain-containing protein [Bacilli bacterium]